MADDTLSESQSLVLDRISANTGSLNDLVKVFADPADAYICSPIPLNYRQLVQMYADHWDEEDRHRAPSELRRRAALERWNEKRTIFQSRRSAIRRDALLEAEAQIWAIVGIEFHATRMRGLMDRWEALSSYVMDSLERCESKEAIFTPAIRDACRELSNIEDKLVEMMPDLAIRERAEQFWTAKAGDRKEIVDRISDRLETLTSAQRGATTFEIISGGQNR